MGVQGAAVLCGDSGAGRGTVAVLAEGPPAGEAGAILAVVQEAEATGAVAPAGHTSSAGLAAQAHVPLEKHARALRKGGGVRYGSPGARAAPGGMAGLYSTYSGLHPGNSGLNGSLIINLTIASKAVPRASGAPLCP